MSDGPWLTIIGLGEDGPDGLTPTSQAALAAAQVIMAPPRHLDLLPDDGKTQRIAWPIPFSDGIPQLLALRGKSVVVLASGDPFWYGAGSVIARTLQPGEWRALPGPSSFSLVAARMGWALEQTTCLGLHAAPMTRLRPHLAADTNLIILLRDGDAVQGLGEYLVEHRFGSSAVTVFEALGGPRENRTDTKASALGNDTFAHPVCVAVSIAGDGMVLPKTAGLPDAVFENDGQITKRPMRALTLSALAPKPNEMLWDIGSGSGSIAIEWLLSHPTTQAISIEAQPDRANRIERNAAELGADRLQIIQGSAPKALDDLPLPDVVFIGGGVSDELLTYLHSKLGTGTRLVANAVTLEAEALLSQWQSKLGGDLLRIELARSEPLGSKRGWRSAFPVVQWSVIL